MAGMILGTRVVRLPVGVELLGDELVALGKDGLANDGNGGTTNCLLVVVGVRVVVIRRIVVGVVGVEVRINKVPVIDLGVLVVDDVVVEGVLLAEEVVVVVVEEVVVVVVVVIVEGVLVVVVEVVVVVVVVVEEVDVVLVVVVVVVMVVIVEGVFVVVVVLGVVVVVVVVEGVVVELLWIATVDGVTFELKGDLVTPPLFEAGVVFEALIEPFRPAPSGKMIRSSSSLTSPELLPSTFGIALGSGLGSVTSSSVISFEI